MRNLAPLLLLGACALLPGAAPAQVPPAGKPDTAAEEQALAGIRPAAIRAHMGFLADDLLEGRRPGSRGYELAAKYVAAQLEALGLAPAGTGGGYFQPVPLLQTEMVAAECSAVLVRASGERIELRFAPTMSLLPWRRPRPPSPRRWCSRASG